MHSNITPPHPGTVLHSPSTAQRVNPYQPYQDHAYAAVCVTPKSRRSCTIIYAGFSDGTHHVRFAGKETKYFVAKRISDLDKPPVFEFESARL